MTFMFKLLGFLAIAILVLALGLAIYTWWGTRTIAWKYAPTGEFAGVDGQNFHYKWFPASEPTSETYVFLHGASGNLEDQIGAFERRDKEAAFERHDGSVAFERRNREAAFERPGTETAFEDQTTAPDNVNRLYIDRPGHGWSQRRAGDQDLTQQGGKIAQLVQNIGQIRGFDQITLVGHSFGAVIAMEMMLQAPELVKNAVLLAPATHPWPSGKSTWYNELVATPIIGPIVAFTVIQPFGRKRITSGAKCVFAPNPMPETYVEDSQIELVLRPLSFIANAQDVAGLYAHTVKRQPDYSKVETPMVIIAGDRDTVVADWIHTDGLVRDVQNAKSFTLHNLGHKPDYIATELAVAAMRDLNGQPQDLDIIAQQVEARIAADTSGPCDLALRLKKEQVDAGQ